MQPSENYNQVAIKKVDKCYCVAFWDRDDCLLEAKRQSQDENIYILVTFNEKLLKDLRDFSSKIFECVRRGGHLSEEQVNYYSYKYKKMYNLGELYFLPKIHVFVKYMKLTCYFSFWTLYRKASDFLDNHLKPIMKNFWSNISDAGDFVNTTSKLKSIPKNAISVIAGVIGRYPKVPNVAGLKTLKIL